MTKAAAGGETRAAAGASLGISIRGVAKSYGAAVALADVSLEIGAGEFVTLLGPSGSGKTTLLNIIAGFVRLDRGQICFGDEDITLRPVNHRGLGMVFQNYALFPHLSVAENVAFPLKVRRVGGKETRERVRHVLDLVQLGHLGERNVAALSGGQRQRVALARAVVFSPKIVLMDEPLSALDKNLREQMQVEIRHLHEKIGATTIYVTHDQREALTMSDRIAVMNHGRIVQLGTPAEIYEHPKTAFVAEFIGETTLVPAERCENGLRLADGAVLRPAAPPPADGPLQVVLRAERVLMPDECGADACRFAVDVRDVIYQGDSLLILTELAGRPLAIRRPLRGVGRAALPRPGDRLTVGLDPASIVVVPAAEG
ncbi:MAG: ABC transporter ATP-binding protein [Candidatus Eiseniibacteriota bacterium]